MAFGQKSGSLKNLKKSLAKTGNGAFIKYIPKNGSMNVRFIQEPEEWVNYIEHFDTVARKSFPCNGEQNCPGCMSGERKSSRYLANVVDRDNSNRVVPLQMPKDLANRLVVKYEKWGSVTDRDIELSRTGEGLDTVYDLDASPQDRKRIDNFQPMDLEKVLEDAYNNVFGSSDEEDEDEDAAPAPKVKGRKKSTAAPKGTTLEDEEDDEDEEEAEEAEEAPKPKARKKAAKEPEFVPDVDEDEDDGEDEAEGPEADDEDDDEDDEAYSEDELRALPLGALRAVARQFGVQTRGRTADQMIEDILNSGDEVEDDDEDG